MRAWLLSLCCLFSFTTVSLWAQGGADAEARFKALEDRIHTLESQVQTLQTALAAAAPTEASTTAPVRVPAPAVTGPGGTTPQAATLPVYGGSSGASKALNPDISVIGNFVGLSGRNPLEQFPALSLRESEFGFQAIIDPYARGDFFVSIGPDGAEIEEGYITLPALKGGFSLKAGQMRANFGKLNALHNHVLPWVDRPLVTFNLLGGDPKESDAGIKDAGLSLSRIIPAPGGFFVEATGEVYKGDAGSLFQSSRRSDVSTIDHIKAYRDLTESTNLEIGGSYARGHNDAASAIPAPVCPVVRVGLIDGGNSQPGAISTTGICNFLAGLASFNTANTAAVTGRDFITQLYGVDATLRWKPLRDRKSTRLNSSHIQKSRMPSSA